MDNLQDYYLLPYEEDYCDGSISIFKDTLVIKDVNPFKFLYFSCCGYCIEKYIKIKRINILRYIYSREIKNNVQFTR